MHSSRSLLFALAPLLVSFVAAAQPAPPPATPPRPATPPAPKVPPVPPSGVDGSIQAPEPVPPTAAAPPTAPAPVDASTPVPPGTTASPPAGPAPASPGAWPPPAPPVEATAPAPSATTVAPVAASVAPAPQPAVASQAPAQPATYDDGVMPGDEALYDGGIESTIALGYGFASLERPDFVEDTASGVTIEVGLSYRFEKEWSVGLNVWGNESPVARLKNGKYGATDSPNVRPQVAPPRSGGYASCSGCDGGAPGGMIFAHSIRTLLVGPRVEYSPSALPGGYVGLGGGLGSITIVESDVAGGVTGRVGYRYGFASSAAVGVGVGVTAILIEDRPAVLTHGAIDLMLR